MEIGALLGVVAPVLRHPAKEGPQGQAPRGIGCTLLVANLEHRGQIPGIEGDVEGRAPEQRRPPIIEQSLHLCLDRAQENQAAGRVLILELVDLRLKQGGKATERTAVARLELVQNDHDARRAQGTHGPGHSWKTWVRARLVQVAFESGFPNGVPEHGGQVRRGAVRQLDQKAWNCGGLVLLEDPQSLLDEGGLADPATAPDGSEEPSPPAQPGQQAAQLVRASVEGP